MKGITGKNAGTTLTLLTLLVGIVLTFWGLVHLQWPEALTWTSLQAFIRYVSIMLVTGALIFLVSWSRSKSPFLIGGAIAISIVLLAGAIWPLLVTVWFAMASTLLGLFILNMPGVKNGQSNRLMCFLVGAGAYGTLVGLMAHFPINYPGVYGLALALPVVLSWRIIKESAGYFLTHTNNSKLSACRVNILDVVIAVVALIYVIVALMPELGFDSLAMHLFVPAHVTLRHQWGFDASTYVWAVMPMLGDWIFSIGYMLGGETAARFFNIGFIFILGWLVREIVLWARGSMIAARWSTLIFLSTPLTFTLGSSLFIESIWTSFVAGGTLALLRVCSKESNRSFEFITAGVLLGCAMAAKSVTLVLLPVLLLLLIFRYKSWFKSVTFPVFFCAIGLFLLMGIIPYFTAWSLTGNPVFPFYNHVFHSPYYPSDSNFIDAFRQGIRWDILYQMTFHSGKYLEARNGVAGFQWLLLFIPAAILLLTNYQRRAITLLIIGILWIGFTFSSTSYLRYVFPSWILLICGIGVALDVPRSGFAKKAGYTLATITVSLNLLFLNAGVSYWYGDFVLKSMIAGSTRDHYLAERHPIRSAVELVNHLNVDQAPVAVFASPLVAGLSADALYVSWYNMAFYREITTMHTEQDLMKILQKRNIHFIIMDLNGNGSFCGGLENQALIEKVSERIASVGSINILKVKGI